jgi:4-hydroxy-tetrahydrodipicolinate synthase
LLGADGWVAGLVNAFPRAKSGRIAEATKIYRWFMPLLELDIHPKLVQYIKLAATKTGLGTENVRAPRLRLTGDERERILKIINDGISAHSEIAEYIQEKTALYA